MGNAKKKERTLKTVGLLTTRPSSLAIHVILKPSCAANRLHALVVLGTQLQAREDGAAGPAARATKTFVHSAASQSSMSPDVNAETRNCRANVSSSTIDEAPGVRRTTSAFPTANAPEQYLRANCGHVAARAARGRRAPRAGASGQLHTWA